MVYFLQAGALFGSEKAKFEPILAILGYFVANLCTFGALFTGLNSAVVPQIDKYEVCPRQVGNLEVGYLNSS